jgi:hypothetical protein
MIEKGDLGAIRAHMNAGREPGCHTMNSVLEGLLASHKVGVDDARAPRPPTGSGLRRWCSKIAESTILRFDTRLPACRRYQIFAGRECNEGVALVGPACNGEGGAGNGPCSVKHNVFLVCLRVVPRLENNTCLSKSKRAQCQGQQHPTPNMFFIHDRISFKVVWKSRRFCVCIR